MLHISQESFDEIIRLFNRRKATVGLSDYSVGKIIDHGGMSNVYGLTDSSGKTDYVLRISEEHKSPYSNDIFNERELRILYELKKYSQPHVVQYLDAFVADMPGEPRYYCSVMKFLCTLKHYRVKGDGVEIAVRLGGDFLPLLQSFTDKSILHRDIKPENIFYDGDFRNEQGFLLGDFGIAKRNTETAVTPTGTQNTMAPEMRGLDRSLGSDRTFADMYSLGMVMYLYLNQGVYPSNSERIDKMPPDKEPFPEPRYGSKRLKRLVVKATSYDPADRFDSPQAMLRELQKCQEYMQFIDHIESGNEITADEFDKTEMTDEDGTVGKSAAPVTNHGRSGVAVRPAPKASDISAMPGKRMLAIAAVAVTVLCVALSVGLWLLFSGGAEKDSSSNESVQIQKVVINEQPQDVITKPNKLVKFKVVASGTGLHYQWYYCKKNASEWSVWRVYYTSEIEPPANSTWDGMQVRCKVTDNNGNSVYSDSAFVSLIPFEDGEFQITKQPKSYSIKKSDVGRKSLTFSVKANGSQMKYQWYFCKKGDTVWTLWDERMSSSFKAVPNDSWNGIQIYCRITNRDGEELYSDISFVTFSED